MNPNQMIIITHDHEKVSGTNYFQTDLAQDGLMHLSVNAGHIHVLCPDQVAAIFHNETPADLKKIRFAQVTQGMHPTQKKAMVRILLEDETNRPLVFEMEQGMCTTLIEPDHRWTIDFIDKGLNVIFSCKAIVSKVDMLPLNY